nr:hypothetical protein [Tanacetum cinerariifolium]
LRRRQHHARFAHAAGRPGAAGDDAVRRSRVRRRRLRPVRHAGVRGAGRVHRRPDDRPHPGIPGQEDPVLRHEDGVDRDPGDPDPGPERHRHRGGQQRRHGR